jgi:hypothetical protein
MTPRATAGTILHGTSAPIEPLTAKTIAIALAVSVVWGGNLV